MVNHDVTNVANVPVVETKYVYPDKPTPVSADADHLKATLSPVFNDPLVGVTNVGVLGTVVSKYHVRIL